MTVLDLGWKDYPRLLVVLADVSEGKDGPSLKDLLASIGDTDEQAEEALGPTFSHFRNPPAPSPEAVQSELVVFRDRFRQAVVERYGQEYADDVWARLTQK